MSETPPNAIGFAVALLAIVVVAASTLIQQFVCRVFVPLCPRCGRRHLPDCATWGGPVAMTLKVEKKGK